MGADQFCYFHLDRAGDFQKLQMNLKNFRARPVATWRIEHQIYRTLSEWLDVPRLQHHLWVSHMHDKLFQVPREITGRPAATTSSGSGEAQQNGTQSTPSSSGSGSPGPINSIYVHSGHERDIFTDIWTRGLGAFWIPRPKLVGQGHIYEIGDLVVRIADLRVEGQYQNSRGALVSLQWATDEPGGGADTSGGNIPGHVKELLVRIGVTEDKKPMKLEQENEVRVVCDIFKPR